MIPPARVALPLATLVVLSSACDTGARRPRRNEKSRPHVDDAHAARAAADRSHETAKEPTAEPPSEPAGKPGGGTPAAPAHAVPPVPEPPRSKPPIREPPIPEPPEGVEALAAMLPAGPQGFGRPITDREAWRALGRERSYRDVIARAEKLLPGSGNVPFPDSPDDLYLDFSRTGNRTRWQRVASNRRGRVRQLVIAECLEDEGRFVPELERVIAALCAERTWVMPAHDRSLANFKRQRIDIDLGSAHLGGELASAHYLLGERLGEETRRLVRETVEKRILTPFRDMARGKRKGNWWTRGTNNWNAVCLAGVTSAAMALVDSREERALFIQAAARYSKSFLKGFTKDGYCSEGVGYWNYGFGNYVVLAEAVRQATGGRVDLLARETARRPALFGFGIEIVPRVCPAFADCGVTSRPSSRILWYVNRRFRLGDRRYDRIAVSSGGNLYEAMMYSFPNAASTTPPAEEASAGPGLRTWFDEAGVLISRPGADSECRLAVAMKGGHNAEHHNHNDVGSYVVVAGESPVLLDPGGEVYTSRTFSSRRYESKVLNSFGHPVPRVAGKLQRKGRDARGRVVRTEFTDTTDTLVLDIKAAYGVPDLRTLTRTFVYSREGAGSLTVKDEVEFARPTEFGTALVTLGRSEESGPGSMVVYGLDEAVKVEIESEGADFRVEAEEIKEDVRTKSLPVRIGVDMTKPVTKASITVKITPLALGGDAAGGGLLRNGGFELGTFAWGVPRGGMGAVTEDEAAGGRRSLRVADAEKSKGSNIASARVRIDGAGAYELRGKVYPVSGSGLGLYVKYYDAGREDITTKDARGYIASVGTLGGSDRQWKPFAFRFETLAETAFAAVWIHSYNAAQVVAYLDELEIVPAER